VALRAGKGRTAAQLTHSEDHAGTIAHCRRDALEAPCDPVPTLLACPFCRELFTPSEGDQCPHCGLLLVDLEKLPPSLEARQEAAEAGLVDPPEVEPQSWWYLGRGRGALTSLAVLGLSCFFAPWVRLERPEAVSLSGFELAKAGVPWLFGGAVGWFLLIPLVWSRRSVIELRGIRIIAATLSVMTALEACLLFYEPPLESGYYTSGLTYAWGLAVSALLSGLSLAVSARLGGSLDDLRDLPGPTGRRSASDVLH
jgi:hypothetical protein